MDHFVELLILRLGRVHQVVYARFQISQLATHFAENLLCLLISQFREGMDSLIELCLLIRPDRVV